MASLIKGISVTLYDKQQIGVDAFNAPIYEEKEIVVDNVIPELLTQDDVVSATELYGKHAVYRLCIPKGDANKWEDRKVSFFGKTWHTYGPVIEYIEENVPLSWNKKVLVEAYE